MSNCVRVWFLRHAESESSANVPGAGEDTPLTERGRSQAIAAARTLAAEPIARIYASTALRARHTAELLASNLGSPPPTPTAPGISVTAMAELVEVYCTAEVLRAWVVERDLGRAANGEEGEGGETGQQVVARVAAALEQIAAAHRGETVAVVGHVASLTVTHGRLCSLGSAVWGTPLPHARPFLVAWDGDAWHCPAWPAVA